MKMTKKTNQVTGVRTECPSGIKRLLEDRKLNRMANEMAAYLAKHPDEKPLVWFPVTDKGLDIDGQWLPTMAEELSAETTAL